MEVLQFIYIYSRCVSSSLQPLFMWPTYGLDKKTCISSACLWNMSQCLCSYRKIWWRLEELLERVQCVYKCHYLAGTSAYCAHRGWVLLAVQRGGGWCVSACLMDNKMNRVEDVIRQRERETKKRVVIQWESHTDILRGDGESFWWEEKSINRAMKNEVAS